MPAGTGEHRQLQLFTILHIKKQSVHYRILRSYKDTLHGASDEARTRYLHLGKVALYQMSYTRNDKRYYNRFFAYVNPLFIFFLCYEKSVRSGLDTGVRPSRRAQGGVLFMSQSYPMASSSWSEKKLSDPTTPAVRSRC